MGIRFQRRIKLLPGLRMNVGLGGLSLSAGMRGASVTVGRQGLYGNLGLPGTGLSARQKLKLPSLPSVPAPAIVSSAKATQSVTLRLDLDEDGRLLITTPQGGPLSDAIERAVRHDGEAELRAWLQEEVARRNEGADDLLSLDLDLPTDAGSLGFVPEPFSKLAPERPPSLSLGFWDRILTSRKEKKVLAFEAALTSNATARAAWQAEKLAHDKAQERLRWRSETGRLEDVVVMEELLEEALGRIHWPRETLMTFEISLAGRLLQIDVDLPEIEDMPRQIAEVARRGLKLNLKERTERQLRKLYAEHIHGVIFRVVGTAFATLPRVQQVVCSGYSQRANPSTGEVRDDYLLSAVVERGAWKARDDETLPSLDPSAFLASCQLRRDMSVTGIFGSIIPFTPNDCRA